MLQGQLMECLGPDTCRFLQTLGAFAEKRGEKIYLVGGVVRDVLLQRQVIDYDLMVCGDVYSFLEELKRSWGRVFPQSLEPSKVVRFPKYRTAKLGFQDGSQIDFSGARREVYPVSGGKPSVSEGTTEEDLLRRDFSINAMAIGLTPKAYSKLIDPCKGREDLEHRILRVLHERSFVDDPARLLRAVRFMGRLSFSMDEKTFELFTQAQEESFLSRLPKRRHYDELKKMLGETLLEPVLKLYSEKGLFSSTFGSHGALPLDKILQSLDVEERMVLMLSALKDRSRALDVLELPEGVLRRLESYAS